MCPVCRGNVEEIMSMEDAIANKTANDIVNEEFKTSSKLNQLVKIILDEIKDHKIVIVSQWRELLRLVSDTLVQVIIFF